MKRELSIISCIAGFALSYIGYQTAIWLGSSYISDTLPWGMSTYIRIPANTAYMWCGVLPMWLGGLFTGIVAASILSKKYTKTLILLLFLAIALTALGFNTMDWMLAPVVWAGEQWQTWVIWRPDIWLESWNYYFFLGVAPLFIGGLLISVSILTLMT